MLPARPNLWKSADPARHEPGMDTVGHGSDLTKYQHEPMLGDFGKAIPGTEPVQMPEGRFAEADAELARIVAREAYEEQQRQAALAQQGEQGAGDAAMSVQRTDAAIAAVTEQTAALRQEPVLADAPLAAEPVPTIAPAPSLERRSHLDPLIDAIAPITVAQIVPGEVALQAHPAHAVRATSPLPSKA